jgi:hypothetical protein
MNRLLNEQERNETFAEMAYNFNKAIEDDRVKAIELAGIMSKLCSTTNLTGQLDRV